MTDVDLYDRHPINAPQILDAVKQQGKDLQNLRPSDLRPFDQDHYGGEAVVLALAEAADIQPGDTVADICAGMSGPARLVAETIANTTMIALDYNFSRCSGAAELNERVGFQNRVRVVRCDAQSLPLADNSIDAAISQEALLHIPDKDRVLGDTFRALKPGGRLAFTDLVATDALTDTERGRLAREGMQMVTLKSIAEYRTSAEEVGFSVVRADDLSEDWIEILTERLQMYDDMGEATQKVHGDSAHDQYMGPYAFFVGLVQQGHLGGMRLVLQKPDA